MNEPYTYMLRRRLKLSVPDGTREAVVLLHGLFATRRSMSTAQTLLMAQGYQVINWGYSTLWKSVEEHSNNLRPVLESLADDNQVRSINFLTHSMGGIIARHALSSIENSKMHRIVMLAPPNTGSPLTRVPLGPFERVFPSIAELSESPDSVPNRLSDPDHLEIGIIAAARDPILRIENTYLRHQRDHCVVPTTHFALPRHKGVLHKCISFLAYGRFEARRPPTQSTLQRQQRVQSSTKAA